MAKAKPKPNKDAKLTDNVKPKRFRAPLEAFGTKLGWRTVTLPFNVKEAFGSGARLPVRGTVNGYSFRTSIFPMGGGRHILMFNKFVQKGAGIREAGEMLNVVVELDTEERTIEVPTVLKKVLMQDKSLVKFFDSLTYSIQKSIVNRVMEPKSPLARERRSEQFAVQMLEVLEGERETPPILKAAFMECPQASVGWKKMTPTQRRHTLFSIFHYRNPDSRARRLDKAVQEMLKRTGTRN
jgi:uncharacterized protein YdeI (YjbR/CyaY-like superfamily)